MSNYSQTTFFTPKDTLPVNNPAKTIFGAAYDVEFGNISTAIASKADSTGVVLSVAAGTGISVSASVGAVTITNIGVTSLAGTANQIAVSGATGAVTLSLPQNLVLTASSGDALDIHGAVGAFTTQIFGNASSGNSFGLNVQAGTTAADVTLSVLNAAASSVFLRIFGDGHGSMGPGAALGLSWTATGNVTIAPSSSGTALTVGSSTSGTQNATIGLTNFGVGVTFLANQAEIFTTSTTSLNIGPSGAAALNFYTSAVNRLNISAAGNVSINAPASAGALSINGAAGVDTLTIVANSSAGNSFGAIISAGTSSVDSALRIFNQATTTAFLRVAGDGGVILAAATGGDQGLGTLNATGLFINGVSVGSGATGTFTGTLATGGTTTPTVTCKYTKIGNSVTLRISTVTYTSNATGMTLTGVPAAIQPATGGVASAMSSVFNNGSTQAGFVTVSGGTLTFLTGTVGTFTTGGFTPTGTKGISQDTTFVYDVN